jgi:small subunit ribosomal protein S23
MQNYKLDSQNAYDQARQEFYDIRHQEGIQRRVAREEALAYGAYFDKSPTEIGIDVEQRIISQDWRPWADQQLVAAPQRGAGSDIEATAEDEPATAGA